jgi:hypothetical protein
MMFQAWARPAKSSARMMTFSAVTSVMPAGMRDGGESRTARPAFGCVAAALGDEAAHQSLPNRPRGRNSSDDQVDGENADLLERRFQQHGGEGFDFADEDAGDEGAGDGAEAAEGDGARRR